MDFEASGQNEMAIQETGEASRSNEAIHFGPFTLLPREYLLLKDSQPVPLGSRAMALLVAFATRPGELLEKAELLALAWPRAVVEECNLRAQIVALRRALDADENYIVTVPGRGYRFVAPVSVQQAVRHEPAPADTRQRKRAGNQPSGAWA